MSFDFYQLYKDYTNIELLKIVRRPTEYQSAAVAVATRVLSERQVTEDEIQFVDQYLENLHNSTKTKDDRINALKHRATDFFEPVLYPSEKLEPRKWLNILLFIIAIQYAWSLVDTIKQLISFLRYNDFSFFDIIFFLPLLHLLYIPLIFFLLIKRRRWGWILVFGDNLVSLLLQVGFLCISFSDQDNQYSSASLLLIFIKAAFVFFLWRDQIGDHFKIDQGTKRKVALVTVAGTVLFVLVMLLVLG